MTGSGITQSARHGMMLKLKRTCFRMERLPALFNSASARPAYSNAKDYATPGAAAAIPGRAGGRK
jgi:hypothetical protein